MTYLVASDASADYDVERGRLEREWRGRVYQARAQVRRLTGAWPDVARRTPAQRNAIRQARTIAAATILAARREGVTCRAIR